MRNGIIVTTVTPMMPNTCDERSANVIIVTNAATLTRVSDDFDARDERDNKINVTIMTDDY
jgi:hypothetical protein